MKLLKAVFGRRGDSSSDIPAVGATPDLEAVKAAVGSALVEDLIKERRSERRWRHLRRLMISGSAIILFGIYVFFYVTSLGYRVVPRNDIVGVVSITGPITENSPTASASAVIPALSKAFNRPNVRAIVLHIDSPGGKPAEVERIYNYIDAKKAETKKPVVSVISNTGASAAYMVALHTDHIYAGKYSLVGSIGAVMTGWDFHKVAERFDVRHRVYASGSLKAMLDPWNPTTAEADAKAQEIVDGMGRIFADEVTRLRGEKLAQGVDFFSGEVWTGEEAKALGLIDEVNTLDSMIKQRFQLGYHDFGPKKSGGGIGFPFSSLSQFLSERGLVELLDRLGFVPSSQP